MQTLLAISVLCVIALVWVALSIARYINTSHRQTSVNDGMLSIVPLQRSLAPEFHQQLALALKSQEPMRLEETAKPAEISMRNEIGERKHIPMPQLYPAQTPVRSEVSYEADIPSRTSQLQMRTADLRQNVRDISSNKSWNMPLKPLRSRIPSALPRTQEAIAAGAVMNVPASAAPTQKVQIAKEPVVERSNPVAISAGFDSRHVIEAGTESTRKPLMGLRRGITQRLDRAYANKDAGDLTDPYEMQRTGTAAITIKKQVRS